MNSKKNTIILIIVFVGFLFIIGCVFYESEQIVKMRKEILELKEKIKQSELR